MKRPPIDRLFFTAPIGQMAVARRDGGISWADAWGDQQGILLWEDQESAAVWQIERSGRPVVVVEFGRGDIDTSLLERVRDRELQRYTSARQWIYPQEIRFSHVRWHTYREELAQEAGWITVELPAAQPEQPPEPGGLAVFHANGTMTLTWNHQ